MYLDDRDCVIFESYAWGRRQPAADRRARVEVPNVKQEQQSIGTQPMMGSYFVETTVAFFRSLALNRRNTSTNP